MSISCASGTARHGEGEHKQDMFCPQGAHSLTGETPCKSGILIQWGSLHSIRSALGSAITDRGASTRVGLPAEVTKQNFEGGIDLNSMKTDKARTFQIGDKHMEAGASQPGEHTRYVEDFEFGQETSGRLSEGQEGVLGLDHRCLYTLSHGV